MAFTQQIQPVGAPNYGSNSRAVDIDPGIKPQGVAPNNILPEGVKEGDKSAMYAGEAEAAGIKADAAGTNVFGELFTGIVKTAGFLGKAGVEMVKKDIEDKVYNVADRERQAYTDTLEKIKAGGGIKGVLDSNPENAGDIPGEIGDLPSTLEGLESAKGSGKISGSYYQSQLLSLAKNLRAQYPGFREEIDQAFTKVTGSNPANAYIRSLVSDINRAATSGSSERNRALTYIQNHSKYPGAYELYQGVASGKVDPSATVKWSAPYEQQDYQLTVRDALHKDTANTLDTRKRIAGDNVDYASGVVVNRAVDQIMMKMGLNSGDDLNRLVSMAQTGAITENEWRGYGQMVATVRAQLAIKMQQDADAHGYTRDVGGKAALNTRINDSLKPLDNIIDRVYHHDFGGIYDTKMFLASQNDETKKKLLDDPKLGPYLQVAQAVKDIGGEQNLQKFNLETIKGNFADDFKSYFSSMQKNMASQYNMRTTGVPYTFNDTIDHLKKNKVSDAKFNRAVLGEVSKITDTSIPEAVRENYALAAFSPGNRGMISRLEADGYDSKGRQVQGQQAVAQKFMSDGMTAAMYELGKKNPAIWSQYVTWHKETLTNELIPQEIQTLAKVDQPYSNVAWDSKNHRLDYSFVPPKDSVNTPSRGDKLIEASVNKINSNIYNFLALAKRTGEDPDALILKTISDSAGPEALKNINGIPYKIMRDIGLSRLQMMNNAR